MGLVAKNRKQNPDQLGNNSKLLVTLLNEEIIFNQGKFVCSTTEIGYFLEFWLSVADLLLETLEDGSSQYNIFASTLLNAISHKGADMRRIEMLFKGVESKDAFRNLLIDAVYMKVIASDALEPSEEKGVRRVVNYFFKKNVAADFESVKPIRYLFVLNSPDLNKNKKLYKEFLIYIKKKSSDIDDAFNTLVSENYEEAKSLVFSDQGLFSKVSFRIH
jgi:hypothetical protein